MARYEKGVTLEQARHVEVGDVICLDGHCPLKVVDAHKTPASSLVQADTPRSMAVRLPDGTMRLLIVTAQSETLHDF
jgi:hypothetical protein